MLMTLVRVVDRDGVEHEVDAKPGVMVMESLRELDYGIAAICGGMCSCATCHIYIDRAWLEKLPAPRSDEKELLGELVHYHDNSRLSCQVEITEALAGIRLTIAPDE
jgi:2Fe-2S ferredoxin